MPIKRDVFAAKETQETNKRDKKIQKLYLQIKSLSLHWNIYLFSSKDLYLINCDISLHWVGLISRRVDRPNTVEVQLARWDT